MSLFSSHWYRVADLRPCLRSHVQITRHLYRGQTWYVLDDPSAGRQHRFSRNAHFLIGLMNGRKTVQEIWDMAVESLGDEAPSQDEVIGLLGRLHNVDVLQSGIPVDQAEMSHRRTRRRGRWLTGLKNPFALRFPLVDPDRFLVRWLPLVRPLAGRAGMLLWLAVVATAALLALLHWPELTRNLADRVLRPENLVALWLVYPLVKLLHELAHGFVTRLHGGEVHEMGVMLLAFIPIPYVVASSSAAFPDKRRRMAVAAAGIAAELFVASLALFVWLAVGPGWVSAIAFNVLLVGGVSTLLFNGNPLLRYDGYYVLADWLEIPNLAHRSTSYLGYLLQRYLFGLDQAMSPASAPGERRWFVLYGVASFCYRMFTLAMVALFVSGRFFTLGLVIALWGLVQLVVLPAGRQVWRLWSLLREADRQGRFLTCSTAAAVLIALLLFVLPAPLRTRTEGVVSLAEQSMVRAGADCFVRDLLARDGDRVQRGKVLLACEDPYLEAEVRVLAANLEEARARHQAQPLQARNEREILAREISAAEAELARAEERQSELSVRSPNSGVLILPGADQLPGRFVRQGELLGYVRSTAPSLVRAVVSQADIALVRERTRQVELRLAGSPATVHIAAVARETPAAVDTLPSAVLGTTGGGRIVVDPADPEGRRALSRLFQVEIGLELAGERVRIGERVHVLFDHGYEPLGRQWFRALHQLFLRRFHA